MHSFALPPSPVAARAFIRNDGIGESHSSPNRWAQSSSALRRSKHKGRPACATTSPLFEGISVGSRSPPQASSCQIIAVPRRVVLWEIICPQGIGLPGKHPREGQADREISSWPSSEQTLKRPRTQREPSTLHEHPHLLEKWRAKERQALPRTEVGRRNLPSSS